MALSIRIGCAALVATLATGCAEPRIEGAAAHELADFDPANLMPKSTPRQMVATFEKACLNDFATDADLRGQGFVPLSPRNGTVIYLSDDRRPKVFMARDAKACAVAASSRTGQTEALRAMVARRFPEARAVDAATLGRLGAEQAWVAEGSILYLQRQVSKSSRLIFGIIRTA